MAIRVAAKLTGGSTARRQPWSLGCSHSVELVLGRRVASHRARVSARSGDGDTTGSEKEQNVDKVLDELKRTGMTRAKAKDVLNKWKELGATDPDSLRKLLVNRSTQPIRGIAIQAVLDTLATFGGFFTGWLTGRAEEFPGQLLIQIFAYFLGCYYAIQVFFEVSAIAALYATSRKYGTGTAELLGAVQQLAGPGSGISVLNKAQLAVNTLKVLQMLDSIVEMLKERAGESDADTLRNLSAYLTLQRAEERYGFVPEKYGLSEREAGDIARVFSVYDTNDDARLELRELRGLCESLGKELNDAELAEARNLLDTNRNGYIEFEEFVEWWTGGKRATTAASDSRA